MNFLLRWTLSWRLFKNFRYTLNMQCLVSLSNTYVQFFLHCSTYKLQHCDGTVWEPSAASGRHTCKHGANFWFLIWIIWIVGAFVCVENHDQILQTENPSGLKKSNEIQKYADIYLLLNYSTNTEYFVTFEEACSPDSMICTRGSNYSCMYPWCWGRWTPETCRIIKQ